MLNKQADQEAFRAYILCVGKKKSDLRFSATVFARPGTLAETAPVPPFLDQHTVLHGEHWRSASAQTRTVLSTSTGPPGLKLNTIVGRAEEH